jgi:predicted RNA-binding protein
MCLSTVYEVSGDSREKVCEYVSTVRAEDGKVILMDIMGVETVLRGSIRSLDLVNNEILVEKGA